MTLKWRGNDEAVGFEKKETTSTSTINLDLSLDGETLNE